MSETDFRIVAECALQAHDEGEVEFGPDENMATRMMADVTRRWLADHDARPPDADWLRAVGFRVGNGAWFGVGNADGAGLDISPHDGSWWYAPGAEKDVSAVWIPAPRTRSDVRHLARLLLGVTLTEDGK